MSEEEVASFWEVNIDDAPNHKSDSADPTLPDRATPIDEEAAPEKTRPIGPMPTHEPDDSRRTDASAGPMEDSQDTKPVEPVHAISGRDRTGALADNTHTPRPLYLQATIGTVMGTWFAHIIFPLCVHYTVVLIRT